jgi:hypothetical protein
MFIKETNTNIKAEFPQEYAEIVADLNKKGIAEADIEWGYEYGVRIGGPEPIINTQQDAIEHAKTIYGISIKGSNGKKNKSVGIDAKVNLPTMFQNMAINNFVESQINQNQEKNRIANLDSILKAVGKTGTAEDRNPKMPAVMNGMEMMQFMMQKRQVITYPTTDDIKQARPDIYQKYELLADGTKLVTFEPSHKECDEWGFRIEPIQLVSKRDGELRFVVDYPHITGLHYLIKDNKKLWAGHLQGVDKAIAAAEGSDFTGWKRTKQYRLTKQEITAEIGGKIFENGGIAF